MQFVERQQPGKPRGGRRQAVRASQGIRLRRPPPQRLHGSITDRETRKVLISDEGEDDWLRDGGACVRCKPNGP